MGAIIGACRQDQHKSGVTQSKLGCWETWTWVTDTRVVPTKRVLSPGIGTEFVGKDRSKKGSWGVGEAGLVCLEVADNYDRVRRGRRSVSS